METSRLVANECNSDSFHIPLVRTFIDASKEYEVDQPTQKSCQEVIDVSSARIVCLAQGSSVA